MEYVNNDASAVRPWTPSQPIYFLRDHAHQIVFVSCKSSCDVMHGRAADAKYKFGEGNGSGAV